MDAAASHGGGRGIGLERERIVTEALTLLNEVGYTDLTLRKLAARLHVQAAALYWHFENKQDLIDAMAVRMMHDQFGEPPKDAKLPDWRTLLTFVARTNRKALLSYRDGAQVMAHADMRRAFDDGKRELLLGHLRSQGFSNELAMVSMFTIVRYTLGCVFEEQADPRSKTPSYVPPHFHRERFFEAGLELMLDGIEQQLKA